MPKRRIKRWTQKQKEWLRRRDNNQCQFVEILGTKPGVCHSQERIECHHVIPFNWSKRVLHWKEPKINSPGNGVCLCWRHHQEILHPDYGLVAKKLYRFDENSYRIIANRHIQMAKAGIKYWYDGFDDILGRIARERTREYKKSHPDDVWPGKEK